MSLGILSLRVLTLRILSLRVLSLRILLASHAVEHLSEHTTHGATGHRLTHSLLGIVTLLLG